MGLFVFVSFAFLSYYTSGELVMEQYITTGNSNILKNTEISLGRCNSNYKKGAISMQTEAPEKNWR